MLSSRLEHLRAPEMRGFPAIPEGRDIDRSRFDRRVLLIGLAVFAGYYLGARIGFALTFEPHPISVLWPPNSILTAALLLTPPRIWWFILLAALPGHWMVELESDVPPLMVLSWFISNASEALIGAGLARWLIGGPPRFTSLRNVAILCFAVVFAGPFLSSFLDAAFVKWNQWGEGAYWELWRLRVTSNVLAALTIVPLIVSWATSGTITLQDVRDSRYVEALLLFLGLVAISFFVLYDRGSGSDRAELYLLLPFLLWAAARFGVRGGSTAVAMVAFLAIWSAAHGHGPFLGRSPEQNALSIQMFLIAISLPLMFLAVLVEERAKAETALREREARISLATESANLALWVCEHASGAAWMSEKGRAIYGFGTEEALTRESFIRSVHPDDREIVKAAFERTLGPLETCEVEHRIVKPGGETSWVIMRGRCLFDEQGKAVELIGVTIDVTPRKQADLQLQAQREELAHLSRVAVMGEMAMSLAHELTQPLTGIVSNADAGRRLIDHKNADFGILREMLADISADGHRAGGVVHGIRRMVKKVAAVHENVNLNDVVEHVVQMVSHEASLHSCKLKTSLEPNLPAIEGDPIELQQVLINLVINAFDAMRNTPAGERRIAIATKRNGSGTIEVSVRDYGSGLSEDTRNHLFEQFFTTKAEGLGMGLAIARTIVHSHGGTITGRNAESGGARFSLLLPVPGPSSGEFDHTRH
jgi:two-component system sensor kinase FixL